MSSRSNPFEELERLFDRLSERFEESTEWWAGGEFAPRFGIDLAAMAIDLVEHDDEFVVTVDLPGFDRDEVDVSVTDHTLRIEADHEEAVEESEGDYLRRERRESALRRSIRLPADVDPEGVDARIRNGVLTVTLPKVEAEAARRIDID